VLALGCYAVHAGVHLYRHEPEDLLWACHLGAALVGVGLLAASALLNGIGTLFLGLGTPLWVLDLLGGGEFLPSSCLTHLGGLAIGLYGIRRLGIPRATWWMTTAALGALIVTCRLVTPPRANVNVAFAIPSAWQGHFPSHRVYLVTMIGMSSGYFWVVGYALLRWLPPRSRQPDRSQGHENVDSSP
jgi:hypothetical protein